MTAVYLLVLAIFAWDKHPHWNQLHPWTTWFIILVLVAVIDLVAHKRYL
jgi:hypothetical protein